MPSPLPPETPSSQPVDRARLVASGVSVVQAVFLLGFCVFSLYELTQHGSDDAARVVTEALLVAVFAAGLLALGHFWVRGANWPNTPTIVWNALLLPVAWGLVQGGRTAVGLVVGTVALVGIGAAVLADTSSAR